MLFSNLEIYIKNLNVSTDKINDRMLGDDYKITICLNVVKKLPILKIIITKEKLEKINFKNKLYKIKRVDLTKIKINKINKKKLKIIKKYRPQIEYIDLNMDIGTEDAALTSYIVTIIGAIFGITLKQSLTNSDNNKFVINPVYANKNILKLELNCIIKIKMLHIIYIIYILKKKRRDDKNVRTSNRRAYGYSYE